MCLINILRPRGSNLKMWLFFFSKFKLTDKAVQCVFSSFLNVEWYSFYTSKCSYWYRNYKRRGQVSSCTGGLAMELAEGANVLPLLSWTLMWGRQQPQSQAGSDGCRVPPLLQAAQSLHVSLGQFPMARELFSLKAWTGMVTWSLLSCFLGIFGQGW